MNYEFIAKTGCGGTLKYRLANGETLKDAHKRLLNDDPIWRRPRIRASAEYANPAAVFLSDRLEFSNK